MDRTLVSEFSPLVMGIDPARNEWIQTIPTDSRFLAGSNRALVQELKLDLSGYTQSDLTVGFRRSFEQVGTYDSITWGTYNSTEDSIIEQTIISSVPMTDANLEQALLLSPGIIPYTGLNFRNFNRTHIIHGHYQIYYPNSTVGNPDFNAPGTAVLIDAVNEYYSSLEPTAADCLYCYRVMYLPRPGDPCAVTGVLAVTLPPKRVILDAFTVEEPDLEYMMRLKRSYELANQV